MCSDALQRTPFVPFSPTGIPSETRARGSEKGATKRVMGKVQEAERSRLATAEKRFGMTWNELHSYKAGGLQASKIGLSGRGRGGARRAWTRGRASALGR